MFKVCLQRTIKCPKCDEFLSQDKDNDSTCSICFSTDRDDIMEKFMREHDDCKGKFKDMVILDDVHYELQVKSKICNLGSIKYEIRQMGDSVYLNGKSLLTLAEQILEQKEIIERTIKER